MTPLTPTQILAAAVFLGSFAELTLRLVAVDLLLLRLHGRAGTISRAMDLLGTPPVIAGLGLLTGVAFVGLAVHFWADPEAFGARPLYYAAGLLVGGVLAGLTVHLAGLY